MTGGLQVGANLVVHIDHSDIREGCIDELKDGVRRLVDVIEQLEPQLIGYGFHFDEVAGRMMVTAVHPGSASLELHMEVGREEFRKLSGMPTLAGTGPRIGTWRWTLHVGMAGSRGLMPLRREGRGPCELPVVPLTKSPPPTAPGHCAIQTSRDRCATTAAAGRHRRHRRVRCRAR